MVEIMFPEIDHLQYCLKKCYPLRVLECVITQDGVEIYGRRKFVYNESRNEALFML